MGDDKAGNDGCDAAADADAVDGDGDDGVDVDVGGGDDGATTAAADDDAGSNMRGTVGRRVNARLISVLVCIEV